MVGPSRIIAELKGAAPDELAACVAALAGVGDVQHAQAGSWTRLTISGDDETDARSAVAALAAEKGYPLRELRRDVASLEDFFVQITYDQSISQARREPA